MTVADPPREAADDPAIILQQAAILHKQRNIDAAEDMYRRVLLADPGNPDALRLLGEIAAESRSYDVAEQLIARAVKIAPVSGTYASLAVARMRRGDVEGAVWAYQRALDLEPSFLEARDRLIFALDLHPWVPWDVKLAARREFDERHGKALTLAAPPHRNSRDPERKLRIGYVSADFTYHSAAAAFGPVVLNHDERRFETYLYNVVDRAPDEMAERFKQKADVWYDIAEATPSELAEVIRKDRIDILVDLSGYSAGNRLPTFARKPAPIQVTGWGYATGTGLSCMDYLIADAVAVPPEHEERYTEKILRLPCLLAHEPLGDSPDIGPPPVERNGYLTFGYLGRPIKLNDRVLSAWAEILRRVPGSRLIFKGGEYRDPRLTERIGGLFGAFGIATSRLDFRFETVRYRHLETFNEIDLCLDPFPHGGGAGSVDCLLMGVPYVTLLGDTVSGRTGASILTVVGEPGWVVASVAEYIEAAVRLAQEPRSKALRRLLRQRLERSIILDGAEYTKVYERRLRAIWRSWCSEQWRKGTA